jgi:hypothetical protein
MSDNALDKVLAEKWYILDKTGIYFRQPPTVDHEVCIVSQPRIEADADKAKARAAVAAKAPQLARQLEKILDSYDHGYSDFDWTLREARALLAAVREAAGE